MDHSIQHCKQKFNIVPSAIYTWSIWGSDTRHLFFLDFGRQIWGTM